MAMSGGDYKDSHDKDVESWDDVAKNMHTAKPASDDEVSDHSLEFGSFATTYFKVKVLKKNPNHIRMNSDGDSSPNLTRATRDGSSQSVTSVPQLGDDDTDRTFFECSQCGINHVWNTTTWIYFLPDALHMFRFDCLCLIRRGLIYSVKISLRCWASLGEGVHNGSAQDSGNLQYVLGRNILNLSLSHYCHDILGWLPSTMTQLWLEFRLIVCVLIVARFQLYQLT